MKAEKKSAGTDHRGLQLRGAPGSDEPGRPVSLTCPECGGPIAEIPQKAGPWYRCQVGHRFSLHAILAARLQDTERSLWHLASNGLETANLAELLSRQCVGDGAPTLARKYRGLIRFCRIQFAIFRKMVIDLPDGIFGEETARRSRRN